MSGKVFPRDDSGAADEESGSREVQQPTGAWGSFAAKVGGAMHACMPTPPLFAGAAHDRRANGASSTCCRARCIQVRAHPWLTALVVLLVCGAIATAIAVPCALLGCPAKSSSNQVCARAACCFENRIGNGIYKDLAAQHSTWQHG